jgi:DNA-directed RNA polymerase specialized sigma subunit
MTAKEYLEETDLLRKRIARKENEIRNLYALAEGMTGTGNSDMPKAASPKHDKMESAVDKIIILKDEIKAIKTELNNLISQMRAEIQQVQDDDARDLLTKRYLEFKPWKIVAADMEYSVQHIYFLHNKALEKLRVHQSS